MSQNLFRFTLLHDSGDKVISEPEGWAKIKFTLERDKDFHSLIELIETPLVFYGSNGVHDGGMSYLDSKKLDDQVGVQIEISEDEGISWDLFFNGLIDMQSKQRIDSRKLQFVITRNDLWARFKARFENSVDIQSATSLDGETVDNGFVSTILLPPQRLRQLYDGYMQYNFFASNFGGHGAGNEPYHIIEYDKETFDEINNKYTYPMLEDSEIPFPKFSLEYSGQYRIQCHVTANTQDSGSANTNSSLGTVDILLQINSETPIAFSKADRLADVIFGTDIYVTDYDIDITRDLQTNDSIRIYAKAIDTGVTVGNTVFFGLDGFSKFEFSNVQDYSYDASTNLFPATSSTGGTITNTMSWNVGIPGVLGGINVYKDWVLKALVNSPGQTPSNWDVSENGPVLGTSKYGYTSLKVTANTITQSTSNDGFLLHDVAGCITDRITSQSDSFYSEYLGSDQTLYRQYVNDGCGWPNILARGLQIRQYSLLEKPFSMSFKQWWEGANPIMNLGLTYDIISASQVIRVEEKAYFYNDSPILYLDWVNNIIESYDKDYIFNKIKVGYKKWQSEDISGIDDPQTNHEYATLFKTVGDAITIQSDFIAASYAIETTRRTTRIKSADYKFDDDTFIIAINPVQLASPAGEFTPELDENFTSVTNLLNSDTRYNLTLTPARNLARWGNLLLGCLKDYLTSSFNFTQGEGNYDMVSDYDESKPGICFAILPDSLSEKQNISASTILNNTDYLFQPILLDFKFPLSYTNYKLIRDNRTRAIAVSTTDGGHTICHIKRLEYDVINSLGTFTVWKK